MSTTPVFDATLADAPVNIWQASAIFPRPGEPSLHSPENWTPPLQPDFTDWRAIAGKKSDWTLKA